MRVLVIAGSMGSGKTKMLRASHAAIDIDAFPNAHDPAAAIETGAKLSRLREPGLWQQKYVDCVAVLEAALDKAALEDFSLANDGIRRVTDVAGEILQRAGWGGP